MVKVSTVCTPAERGRRRHAQRHQQRVRDDAEGHAQRPVHHLGEETHQGEGRDHLHIMESQRHGLALRAPAGVGKAPRLTKSTGRIMGARTVAKDNLGSRIMLDGLVTYLDSIRSPVIRPPGLVGRYCFIRASGRSACIAWRIGCSGANSIFSPGW